MVDPVVTPSHLAVATPPRPASRRGLWALPLLLSLLFVAAVLGWLRATHSADAEEQRLEMITDALSLESQMTARIDRELLLLKELASAMGQQVAGPQAFANLPEVQLGLRRFWISITWLDAKHRQIAQLPNLTEQSVGMVAPAAAVVGTSSHLSVSLADGGSLVARYSPADMLRQNVPWWLARKYDVRFVDSFGNVMASTTEGRDTTDLQTYRISMAPIWADTYLELIARGRLRPWYRSVSVLMVGGFVLLIVLATLMLRKQVLDVSRAEAAWRTEAAWRRAMEDSLVVGLRARDLQGRLVYVNRALADMVGFEPEELLGLLPPMPYWPADSLEEIMVRHRRNLAGQAPREGYEAVWRHRSGRLLDVMVFEAPLVDAGGRHVGWMGSVLDITERKRLEERERRRTDTTAHHARLTMLGEVASTLAHELNQPLTAISSYNAGVLNSLQRHASADPAVLSALKRMGEQAANAGRIVHRIREFLTRREPRLEKCALNAVVQDGVALLARELKRHEVQLKLQLDPNLPELVLDTVLLEQVVINLVRNACDALSELPEQPAQPGRPRAIEVQTSRSADQRFVRIDVRDNGPGLKGQSADTLCAPFYSTKNDGMGMGLAICRSIVEAHQGVLDASDNPGGGACFSFTLPVNLAQTVAPVAEAA
jgi:two-component system sensor histidine kinase DctS